MTAFVTGATGLIGRRLVARLLADGEEVRALALSYEDAVGLEGAEVVRGDITDAGRLMEAVRGADRVYHLAAIVGDWGDEADFVAVNVDGTRNLLEAAAAAHCQRFLMVSSIVVYGSQMRTAVCDEENTPRELGVGPYSRTKRASEDLALDYHAFGRVPVTVVRPGNVWGPSSALWVDEVAGFLRSGRNLLVDRGEGDAILAYVDNVVEVIVLAARAPVAAGRIYNANDGSGVTWRRYFQDLSAILGVEPPERSVSPRVALAVAAAMERVGRAMGRPTRPLLTREAVTILSSRSAVPIRRAVEDLGYRPPVSYHQGMERVAAYLKGGIR